MWTVPHLRIVWLFLLHIPTLPAILSGTCTGICSTLKHCSGPFSVVTVYWCQIIALSNICYSSTSVVGRDTLLTWCATGSTFKDRASHITLDTTWLRDRTSDVASWDIGEYSNSTCVIPTKSCRVKIRPTFLSDLWEKICEIKIIWSVKLILTR